MNEDDDGSFDDYVVTTTHPGPMLAICVVLISMSFFILLLVANLCRHQKDELEKEQQCHTEMENDGFMNNYQSLEGCRASMSVEALPQPTTTPPQASEDSMSASAPTRRSLDNFFHRLLGNRGDDNYVAQSHPPTSEQAPLLTAFRNKTDKMDVDNDDNDDNSDSEIDVNVVKFSDPTVSSCEKLKIITCHNFDPVTRSVARLSVPFLLQALLSATCDLIQLALVGHRLGTMSLSAFVIVDLLVRLTDDVVGSILSAGNKMITQVTESDNTSKDSSYKAGRYLQLSMLLFVAGCIPFILLWSFHMDQVLLFLGYDAETAEMGRQFVIPYAVGKPFAGICSGFRIMLDVVGYEVQSTYLTLIEEVSFTAIVAVFLCWRSMFPNANIGGLGYVFLICDVGYLLAVLSVIHFNGWLQEYMEGFTAGLSRTSATNSCNDSARSFSNAQGVSLILGNASSLAFALLVYHGEWQALIFFASWLGPAEVAAWGLLGSIWDSVEMIISAIGEGCEVVTGNMLGSGKVKKAEYLAYKSFWIGLVSAGFLSLLLISLMYEIPKWLTHDALLQSMLSDLIPMICIANFASAMAVMSGCVMYAQNRFSVATALTFFVSLFVTLPLAGLSSFKYRFDLNGQMGAIVIGMSLTSALCTFVVIQSDWKVLSDEVIASHDHSTNVEEDAESSDPSETPYDDFAWDELPTKIQEAAEVLGYDKRIWNNDLPSPLDDTDWEELTLSQQEAAKLLKYDKTRWDGDKR